MVKISHALVIVILTLGGCGPAATAFMTGFADGMAQNTQAKSQRSRSYSNVNTVDHEAQNAVQRAIVDLKACEQKNETEFNYRYPQYAYLSKSPPYDLSDYTDNRKISGTEEYDAILNSYEASKECIDQFFNDTRGLSGVAKDVFFVLPSAVWTELVIAHANYMSGDITIGKLREKIQILHNGYEKDVKRIVSELRTKAAEYRNMQMQIQQNDGLNELRRENKRIMRLLRKRDTRAVQRYRPIFCHKYYGINTVSCY